MTVTANPEFIRPRANPARRGVAPPAGPTPFIPMSPGARFGVVAFVLLYKVFTPGLEAVVHGAQDPMIALRIALEFAYWMLALAPVMFYRREFGWLHPLIFPVLYGILRSFTKTPGLLLEPLAAMLPGDPVQLPFLYGMGEAGPRQVSAAMITTQLAHILALLAYYAGFFLLPVPKAKPLNVNEPRFVMQKALIGLGAGLAILVTFMALRGGLIDHLTSLSGGRFRALRGMGPVIVLIMVAPFSVALWAAYRPKAVRNPLFWLAVLGACSVGFLSTGSRGAVIQYAAIIGLCIVARRRKIPFVQVSLALPVVFLMIGALGLIRTSAWSSGETNLTAFQQGGLKGVIEYTTEHVQFRKEVAGEVPVFGRVPEEVPYLYGLSYVSSAAFFIPRAIWQDKPRSAGAYYAVHFLGGSKEGFAIPVGLIGEAYWNFGWAGIVLIYLLFGGFHRFVVRWVTINQHNGITWVVLSSTLVQCAPGSKELVEWAQGLGVIFLLVLVFGILRFRKAPPTVKAQLVRR